MGPNACHLQFRAELLIRKSRLLGDTGDVRRRSGLMAQPRLQPRHTVSIRLSVKRESGMPEMRVIQVLMWSCFAGCAKIPLFFFTLMRHIGFSASNRDALSRT